MKLGKRVEARPFLWAVLIIGACAGYVYLTPLFSGRAPYSEDTSDLNYVMLRSHVEDLKERGFVGWCPGVGTGFYRAGDPTYGVYSWRALVFLLVPGYQAQGICIALYGFIAGIGAYLLGRVWFKSWFAALYLGLVWPLSGAVFGIVHNLPYMAAAAWFPWTLAAWQGLKNPVPRVLGVALALSLVGFDGDPVGAVVMAVALCGLSLTLAEKGSRLKESGLSLCSLLLFFLFTAVVWLNALFILPESLRAGGLSQTEAMSFSLHPLRLLNLAAPSFFGFSVDWSFWAKKLSSSVIGYGFWFSSIYLGLLAVPLWAAAFFDKKELRKSLWLLVFAVFFAIVSFGRHFPLFPWMADHFPVFRFFRFPAKFFTFSLLFLLALAGAGFERLQELVKDYRKRMIALLVIAGVFAVCLVGAVLAKRAWFPQVMREGLQPALSLGYMREDILRLSLFTLLVPLCVHALGGKMLTRRRIFPSALLALTVYDLFSARPPLGMERLKNLNRPSPIAEAIKERGPGRLLEFDFTYYLFKVNPRACLKPNWGVLEGVDYAFGKTATMPALISGLENVGIFERNSRGLFRVLAVRYVLEPMAESEEWAEKLELEGVIKKLAGYPSLRMNLYETAESFPRISLSNNVEFVNDRRQALFLALQSESSGKNPKVWIPLTEVLSRGRLAKPGTPPPWSSEAAQMDESPPGNLTAVEREDGDQLSVKVKLNSPGLLVVREFAMKGWRAFVDREEVPIYFADGVGRGVFLDKGEHEVVFRFQPLLPRLGLFITMFGFMSAAASLWKRLRGKGAAGGQGI